VNELDNAIRGIACVFMFPDPDYLPAACLQPHIGIGVSHTVGFDLRAPELCIALRPGGMFGTAVPKTSVDEDGYSCAREDDIGDAPGLRQ
jgi:hypothetical protein